MNNDDDIPFCYILLQNNYIYLYISYLDERNIPTILLLIPYFIATLLLPKQVALIENPRPLIGNLRPLIGNLRPLIAQ